MRKFARGDSIECNEKKQKKKKNEKKRKREKRNKNNIKERTNIFFGDVTFNDFCPPSRTRNNLLRVRIIRVSDAKILFSGAQIDPIEAEGDEAKRDRNLRRQIAEITPRIRRGRRREGRGGDGKQGPRH